MKKIRFTLNILFCLYLLSLAVVGYGSHCDGNPNGCSGCSTTSPCQATLGLDSQGNCICCKDYDGDGIYHYVTCQWQDYTCYITCPAPNNGTTNTTFPCSITKDCTVGNPPVVCNSL